MTNHAYLDRLTALFPIASCGGLSADHGQKRELGGVTITGGLDLIGPITEGREPINLQGVRLARVRYAPLTTKLRSAAKCCDGPIGDVGP
jgi:hypothetical protein